MKIGPSWKERKAHRKDYFMRFVHGWRTKPCVACGGSGYYDNAGSPKCGACEGTGKEKYRGPKSGTIFLEGENAIP